MTRFFIVVLLFLPLAALAQRDFLVVIEGKAQNLLDQQDVYGVTIDIIQQEAVLTKVISNQNGQFYISARIAQGTPIQLRLTKGGYQTKLILFDLTTLQGQRNNPNGLSLIRDLNCALYELKPDVDLSFSKNQITDKYVWSANAIVQVPLTKTAADQKALSAYQFALDQKRYNLLFSATNQALSSADQNQALILLDSMLLLRPTDSFASQKKLQIEADQAAALKRSQDEARQTALLNEAISARTANDLVLASTKIKEAAAVLPNTPKVVTEQNLINNLITDVENEKAKTQAFQNAMKAAAAFVTSKKYDDAEAKYKEAQLIKPSEKDVVNAQLAALKALKFDIQNELELKATLKLANEQFVQKKYETALETYKKADQQIALFSKQNLIDKYSKELQEGVLRVTEGINSMSQVYQNQLAKANENFLKGPVFYGTAKSILNSDPMKSRQNEPEVIALKEKIASMEKYYSDRKEAYRITKSKESTMALGALEKVHAQALVQQQYLNAAEIPALQKSIDSLKQILKPVQAVQVKPDVTVEPAGIRLTAPGEPVRNENTMVFNDLQITREAKQEAPYRIQQEIKTEVDYQNYFAQQSAQVGSFETNTQLEMTRSQRELSAKQYADNQAILQADKIQNTQEYEVALKNREAAAADRQQENTDNLTDWKDAKDHQNQTDKNLSEQRQEAELKRLNEFQNVLELQDQKDLIVAEQNMTAANARAQEVTMTKQQQQEAATIGGQIQFEKIQQTAASAVQLKTAPNYLRDEDGVLFAPNSFTEKTYQIKNGEGYVIRVIIRRVVVDSNGYGVVYEQTTDENGKTYFTRDGQVSTEYVWFNDSSGANVLKK
ncbi:MAG: hypothetical protein RIS63_629 [Bacteroidota bacterium]